MKQGRMFIALGAALALTAPLPAHAASKPAGGSRTPSSAAAPAPKSRTPVRQFTGVVTALDRASLTVEKGGKKPRTMVFTKDADTQTTGAIDKDVRVTVYYRDQDGRAVAQRIVAKAAPAPPQSAGGGR